MLGVAELASEAGREVVDGRGDSVGRLEDESLSPDLVDVDDLPIPWIRALNLRLVAFIFGTWFDVTAAVGLWDWVGEDDGRRCRVGATGVGGVGFDSVQIHLEFFVVWVVQWYGTDLKRMVLGPRGR